MSGIPKQLTFSLERLSGFNKNNIKFPSLNKTSFGPGELMTAYLPANETIDLHSLALHADVAVTNGALPRWTSSLFSRVEVLVNGESISNQALMDYHALYNMMGNTNVGYDKSLEWDVYSRGNAIINSNPGAGSNSYHIIVDNFLGFLSGSFARYVAVGLLGLVEVRILWAPVSVLVAATNTTTTQTYAVTNVSFYLDVIKFSDNFYNRYLESQLAAGPIIIPFKQWASFSYAVSGTGGTCTTSYSTGSLDAVYTALRPTDFDALAPTTFGIDANIGTSPYFRFMGDSAQFQLRVGAEVFPQYLATVPECYTLLKNTLNGGGLNLAYLNNVGTQTAWNIGKFCFAQSFKLHDDMPLSRLASGLSTNQQFVPLVFQFANAALSGTSASGYRPIMFIESTAYLEVPHAGRVIYHP